MQWPLPQRVIQQDLNIASHPGKGSMMFYALFSWTCVKKILPKSSQGSDAAVYTTRSGALDLGLCNDADEARKGHNRT